jgi:GNAT superfamily N-acetyltransferase
VSRSLRYACPPDNVAADRPGCVAWSSASGRGWFAHRLELDRPPADVDELRAALARWDAEGHPPEVDRRAVAWETPWGPSTTDPEWSIPPRFAPSHQLGMVRDPGAPGDPDPRIRPATDADLDAIADAHAGQHPALGAGLREELRWLYRGLQARGATTWSATDADGRPIAAATLVWVPEGRGARLREVWTAAGRRREGLGTALVAAAVRACPSGAVVLACEEGSDAHRIYVRAGFRAVSRFVTASTDRAARERC